MYVLEYLLYHLRPYGISNHVEIAHSDVREQSSKVINQIDHQNGIEDNKSAKSKRDIRLRKPEYTTKKSAVRRTGQSAFRGC
jgi:hypothetical protein